MKWFVSFWNSMCALPSKNALCNKIPKPFCLHSFDVILNISLQWHQNLTQISYKFTVSHYKWNGTMQKINKNIKMDFAFVLLKF